MQRFDPVLVLAALAVWFSCSRSAPSEIVYSERTFSKRAEQTIPASKIHVYTPGAVNQATADEHLNLLFQTEGVSNVPQIVPLVSDALKRTGYETEPVTDRSDALCSTRAIPDGTERIVTLVAARGDRTVQLQHVARNRGGNGVDASCENAAEVTRLLAQTLASVP